MTVPLSALLSHAYMAWTIEFDNEFEHRMPHRTAAGVSFQGRSGPWLVSMAMWSNFMRYVEPDGQPLSDLEGPAATCLGSNAGRSELRQLAPVEGLTPYPEGWRARARPHDVLPDFPLVLHRGGYPDGA